MQYQKWWGIYFPPLGSQKNALRSYKLVTVYDNVLLNQPPVMQTNQTTFKLEGKKRKMLWSYN